MSNPGFQGAGLKFMNSSPAVKEGLARCGGTHVNPALGRLRQENLRDWLRIPRAHRRIERAKNRGSPVALRPGSRGSLGEHETWLGRALGKAVW